MQTLAKPATWTQKIRYAGRVAEADYKGSDYLVRANAAAERGEKDKAERLYAKGQVWLDRYNKLTGNA